MAKVDGSLVAYYQEEMAYLRNAGRDFAKQHPKIAHRLDYSETESSDPHVERLLESFAYLTARLSKTLDDHHPETAQALLNVLYPHLVRPTPSMAISQIDKKSVQFAKGKGVLVPKGTKLLARSQEQLQCRFRTVYDVMVWPIQVENAIIHENYTAKNNNFSDQAVLEITLSCQEDLQKLNLTNLVFFMGNDWVKANAALQTLLCLNTGVYVADEHNNIFPAGQIEQVGLSREEVGLPLEPQNHHSFALLQEYFHCPEKFFFLRFTGLHEAIASANNKKTLRLIISLKDTNLWQNAGAGIDQLQLFCTPIINLFNKPSDPLRIDHQQVHYRLIPDTRRERTTEIYAINSISGLEDATQKTVNYLPFYSRLDFDQEKNCFWYAKRRPALLRGSPGTDMFVSFIDHAFHPARNKDVVAVAEITCTNRYLANELTENTVFEPEEKIAAHRFKLIKKPVPQAYSPEDGDTLWLTISQLANNYIGTVNGSDGLKHIKALAEIFLNRYPGKSHQLTRDLHNLNISPQTRRFGEIAWKGYVEGFNVELQIDLHSTNGGSNTIFASILQHYFSQLVDWQRFIELTVEDPDSPDLKYTFAFKPGTLITL